MLGGHRLARLGGRPGAFGLLQHERPCRAQARLGASDVRLRGGALGERPVARSRRLGGGQVDQVLDRSAGDSERHRRHPRGQQAEERKRIERALMARAVREQRDGPGSRDELILDGHVMAARAAQSRHRPCVDHLDRADRHQHHPYVGAPVVEQLGAVALVRRHSRPRSSCNAARRSQTTSVHLRGSRRRDARRDRAARTLRR